MSEIRTLANSYGHTAFTLLAAACAITLTCPDHHDRLLLGLAVANRDHVAVERVLGFYVTLTVLPVDLRGDPLLRVDAPRRRSYRRRVRASRTIVPGHRLRPCNFTR
ncbi:hypothetical protein ACFQ51_54255 [Streptomyces kaempferi]